MPVGSQSISSINIPTFERAAQLPAAQVQPAHDLGPSQAHRHYRFDQLRAVPGEQLEQHLRPNLPVRSPRHGGRVAERDEPNNCRGAALDA
jgi:hypothetical protein